MVRLSGPDDRIRRYRLARLDEIAIASPPQKADDRPPVQPPPGDPRPRSNAQPRAGGQS